MKEKFATYYLTDTSDSEGYELFDVTISDGVKEGNKFTFNINLPPQTYRRGDVLEDGVIDGADSSVLLSYCLENVSLDQINAVAADLTVDGKVDVADLVMLNCRIDWGKMDT